MTPSKSPARMNFLIVDDVDNMRRSIRAMLKLINFGWNLYEADNGRTAWELLQKNKYPIDFIIADWNMPHLNGTELLHLVRATPRLRDIPFLMITAAANQEIVAEAAEYEVDAYLMKPFVTATLEQKILELLKQSADPNPSVRHLKLARELEERGELDRAIAETRKALELGRHTSRPYRELGRLMMRKEDFNHALTCFQKAVEINRLDVTSYHYLGQLFHRLGRIDKATEFFSKAMQINPRHRDRAISYASLLLKQKNFSEAEKVFKLVLRNCDGDLDLKEEIAQTCMEHGMYDLAAKNYRELLKKCGEERVHLNRQLVQVLLKKGDTTEALAVMEKSAKKHGEDIEVMLFLAQAYLDMKLTIRADKWASRAIKIDPRNQEAREILNRCL